MTTVRDPATDAGEQRPETSPWSAPHPEGPLAEALRRAEAARAAVRDGEPLAPSPEPGDPEDLESGVQALAREAIRRDGAREAMAVTLDWPRGEAAGEPEGRPASWRGWMALAAAIVLAMAAAAIAILLSPRDTRPVPLPPATDGSGLRIERHLSHPAG